MEEEKKEKMEKRNWKLGKIENLIWEMMKNWKEKKKKKEEKLLLLLFGEIVKKIVKKIVKEAEGGREKLGMLKCNNGKRDQIAKKRRN